MSHFDRYSSLRKRSKAMTKNVQSFKGEEPTGRAPVPLPERIVFATEGTHIAQDKKPYTITYDKPEGS